MTMKIYHSKLNNMELAIEFDYTKITNVVVDGIDYKDAPDFCDAYIASCDYYGHPMSEKLLDELNDDRDYVFEQVEKSLY